ncbi:MAG: class I SAM-dependent methyltransferase family protein [Candidatus Methanoperedens sp.]|nr:class I SAM-dependent methyltransferase family protein [Candidatus Methanoperedens sp.]MCZ7371693.1 class I SAM-dependent methyltransferase family protein [Candidatus Methanoperedens sp.]
MESFCIRVPKKDGEKTRLELIALGALDKNLKIKPDGDTLLLPVTRQITGFGDMEKEDFEVFEKEETVADILGFSPSYEQIGDIVVIDRHEPEAQQIADALIKQKKIKTVVVAETSVSGEFRTRELSILAGEKRTETLYSENGCRYSIDLARVYFTPRLSTERMRIANQVKDGDLVVDMFAGVGPFSILIAKRNPASHVIAIDKNPDAIKYLKKNIKLNKIGNVEIREGEAKEAVKGISGSDHIIMNLPHSGLEFLEAALQAIKNGGIIHFYAISHEDDLFDGILKKIEDIARQLNLLITPLDRRIVRPYAPYQYNICIDFQVTTAASTGRQEARSAGTVAQPTH